MRKSELVGTFWRLRYPHWWELKELTFVVLGVDVGREKHQHLVLNVDEGKAYWGTPTSTGETLHVWFPGDSLRSMDPA